MGMDFELIKLIFDNLEYPLYLNDRSGKTMLGCGFIIVTATSLNGSMRMFIT